MTDSKKKSENQEFFIPRFEKPLIRIEADKELSAINDYILIQAGVLPQDFKREYDNDYCQPPEYFGKTYGDHTFTELKTEYLKIQGFEFVTPGWGSITRYDHPFIYLTGVVLTYRSERDLT